MGKYLENARDIKFKTLSRPALGCEEWIDEKQGYDKISLFFSTVRKLLDKEYYVFLVLHFILGTRIKETVMKRPLSSRNLGKTFSSV